MHNTTSIFRKHQNLQKKTFILLPVFIANCVFADIILSYSFIAFIYCMVTHLVEKFVGFDLS